MCKNPCKDYKFIIFCYLDLFKKVKETFGCLDIVCNNAGIGGEVYPLWEKAIDVNLVKKLRTLLWNVLSNFEPVSALHFSGFSWRKSRIQMIKTCIKTKLIWIRMIPDVINLALNEVVKKRKFIHIQYCGKLEIAKEDIPFSSGASSVGKLCI